MKVIIDIPYASSPQGIKYFSLIAPHIDCMEEKYLVRHGEKCPSVLGVVVRPRPQGPVLPLLPAGNDSRPSDPRKNGLLLWGERPTEGPHREPTRLHNVPKRSPLPEHRVPDR